MFPKSYQRLATLNSASVLCAGSRKKYTKYRKLVSTSSSQKSARHDESRPQSTNNSSNSTKTQMQTKWDCHSLLREHASYSEQQQPPNRSRLVETRAAPIVVVVVVQEKCLCASQVSVCVWPWKLVIHCWLLKWLPPWHSDQSVHSPPTKCVHLFDNFFSAAPVVQKKKNLYPCKLLTIASLVRKRVNEMVIVMVFVVWERKEVHFAKLWCCCWFLGDLWKLCESCSKVYFSFKLLLLLCYHQFK